MKLLVRIDSEAEDTGLFAAVRRADPEATVEVVSATVAETVYELTTKRDVTRILDTSDVVISYDHVRED